MINAFPGFHFHTWYALIFKYMRVPVDYFCISCIMHAYLELCCLYMKLICFYSCYLNVSLCLLLVLRFGVVCLVVFAYSTLLVTQPNHSRLQRTQPVSLRAQPHSTPPEATSTNPTHLSLTLPYPVGVISGIFLCTSLAWLFSKKTSKYYHSPVIGVAAVLRTACKNFDIF